MSDKPEMTDAEIVQKLAIGCMGHVVTVGREGKGCYVQTNHWMDPKSYRTWNPLTDGNDMLMVIEAMRKKGFEMVILVFADFYLVDVCLAAGKIIGSGNCDTAQRAVCIAACKALEEQS